MAEQAIDLLPVELWAEILEEFLIIDFRLPLLPPSVPWSRRKFEFDVGPRYSELLENQGRLRLVSRKWNDIVQMYKWRGLDLLGSFDGPPPNSTIVALTLRWHENSSLTKLYSLFAHALIFRRLQQLVISLTSVDRTCNDFATNTFFSHINAFSSTLVSLRLSTGLYNSCWFESPPVLRLANLLHFDFCFGGFLGAFNISKWNCPKLVHLTLAGTIENTNYLSHLASIGPNLQFLSLRRITSGKPFTDPHSYHLHFNGAFWTAFPLLEVLKVDGASRWGSDLSDLPPTHPIRELVVQRSNLNSQYRGMGELFQNFTASNDTSERKRRVTLEDINWNHTDSASLKWNLKATYDSVAQWLQDESGVSLTLATDID